MHGLHEADFSLRDGMVTRDVASLGRLAQGLRRNDKNVGAVDRASSVASANIERHTRCCDEGL
jgi:hypothetical protein